ncbi:MAG: hypothetical protein HFH88_12490 [Lachnospiraceae bacterium]|nr:hypothetical protein [Lachnospiraceae bacterium]
MGVRLTGFSMPVGGLSWEYMEKKTSELHKELVPGKKIKVFISSICGNAKYDTVRLELKTAIEETNLAQVYLFETENASTLSAEAHYTFALEDSDLCIFLIDNADGVPAGVQKEVDVVKKFGIKAIYYFCDEKSSEKTILEKSLIGAEFAKTKTVHRFEELSQDGASALIDDIVSVYRYYCGGKIILKSEDEPFQRINVVGTESTLMTALPKTVLENIDKCKGYILKFATGYSYMGLNEDKVHTSAVDDWGVQFLNVLFEGKPIQQFNTGMFMEVLKELQEEEHFRIVDIRWQAIQAHFAGDVSKCIEYLQKALKLAKDLKRPSWLINDILIDIRNQDWVLGTINNHFPKSEAQQELTNSKEEVHYPILDRVNESLREKYVKGLFKKKIESPYTVTFGNSMDQYGDLLASAYIISLYNGSLTHLLLFYDKIKDFLFYLSSKYTDWTFRRDMLKFAIFSGEEKEVKGIKDAYPEILNNLSGEDAAGIMSFCLNEPIEYKRFNRMLLGLGTVGYYLEDGEFEKYRDALIQKIKKWLDDEHAIVAVGQSIFSCLSDISLRLHQDTLADICCQFIDKHYRRWYTDMLRFIAKHIELQRMSETMAKELICHIIAILESEKDCEEIKNAPQLLYVLREQNRDLTEDLDRAVLKYMPDYYNGMYKLQTSINEAQDRPRFIKECVERIKQNNIEQGKNGTYFGHAYRDTATIRNILVQSDTKYSSELIASIIAVVSDTVLKSKEGVREKIDAINLLICIAILYPEECEKNEDIYDLMYEKRDEINVEDIGFLSSNINEISLKIGLQFLFAAMKRDTSIEVMELLPLVQNDVATTITTTQIIIEYLELGEKVRLPKKMETIILQNALQWIRADSTDIRWNATRILMALLRNPENEGIINHKLVDLIDTDNVYIKNLIMRNLYYTDGIQASSKDYIVSKCRNDANYVVRMVCERESRKIVKRQEAWKMKY